MPTGPRLLLKNVCYHIITRGNSNQGVFLDTQDYETYLFNLRRYKTKYKFLIYAFCLMPNHVHIIGQPKETTDLAKFMHGLNRSYTAYFNTKYDRVGYLWQGRFKSKIVTKDNYIIDCLNYIELNPVKANMVRTAQEYTWSSHKERVMMENESCKIIDDLSL
jgi:putative transposase